MKSLNMKLALSALGIAMLATPALAQRPRHVSHQQVQSSPGSDVGTYPNGATRSGSVMSHESGAEDNVVR
jgi:hypothetical protein